VGLFIFVFSFLDSIAYQATIDDLPQDVYENSGDLLALAQADIMELFAADEADRYSLTEEVINLILLDTVRENVNPDYDPLGDCEDNTCGRIVDDEYFYIDYVYAELNEDNQIVITLSFGANKYIDNTTALILVFDVEFDMDFDWTILDGLAALDEMEIVFTLSAYSLGEKELSMNLLNYIFERLNKSEIEDNMTFGTLNLDDYTYSISVADAFL